MGKKISKTPVTAVTHRLTLEIAKPLAAVWRGFTRDIHAWWPKDFFATTAPQRMILELKPGGRLYEDAGGGDGLVWYHVIAIEAPVAITFSGFIAPPFGGPATSLLRIAFSARSKSVTTMEIVDSTFGCVEESATAEGWKLIFEDGFKEWLERR
jgi:uncharacterized protein YndB with AHSA1/START domain